MSVITSGVGRIGKDAVTREVGSDTVTGFSLAMDNGFGDKKQTLWFDVSGWGKRYTAAAPYLVKGAQVFVTGEQGEREHEGKVYKTLRLQTLDLVGGKPQGDGAPTARAKQPQQSRQPEPDFADDEIGF